MDQQPQALPAAPFPAPPPFWKHFTRENLDKLATISASTGEEVDQQQEQKSLSLELAFLKPPPPPPATAESYTTFNATHSLSSVIAPPPSEVLLFDPQSPDFNPANMIIKLIKSALLNFMELTTVLGNDPVQWEEKMNDIERIMYNVHFVINMYRPHQSREGVRQMLEARLEDGRREIEKCDEMKVKVENFLKSVEQSNDDVRTIQRESDGMEHKEKSRGGDDADRRLWTLIHNLDED